jgi:hypothetical protein
MTINHKKAKNEQNHRTLEYDSDLALLELAVGGGGRCGGRRWIDRSTHHRALGAPMKDARKQMGL